MIFLFTKEVKKSRNLYFHKTKIRTSYLRTVVCVEVTEHEDERQHSPQNFRSRRGPIIFRLDDDGSMHKEVNMRYVSKGVGTE